MEKVIILNEDQINFIMQLINNEFKDNEKMSEHIEVAEELHKTAEKLELNKCKELKEKLDEMKAIHKAHEIILKEIAEKIKVKLIED